MSDCGHEGCEGGHGECVRTGWDDGRAYQCIRASIGGSSRPWVSAQHVLAFMLDDKIWKDTNRSLKFVIETALNVIR